MKTNLFSKVAVTMMTVALGAGIVGSISGTVAWFQYSTRSTVAFTGTSAHCTANLQIRVVKAGQGDEDGWKSDLVASDITAALKAVTGTYNAPEASPVDIEFDETNTGKFYTAYPHGGEYKFVYDATAAKWFLGETEVTLADCGIVISATPVAGSTISIVANAIDTVRPVTSGELAKGAAAATLYRNPLYQYPGKTSWKTAKACDFVTVPLELRVKDVDGSDTVHTLVKDIYVSKMDMAVKEVSGKGDITPALRVAVSAYNGTQWVDYGTFSKDGADVNTYGKLDLNDDGRNDTFGDFAWEKGPEILYGYEHQTVTIAKTSSKLENEAVNGDWFIGKHGTDSGNFVFQYDDSVHKWKLGEAVADLEEYGISYDLVGEDLPANGDKLTVTVAAEAAGKNVAQSYGLTAVTTNVGGIADDSDPYNIKGTPIGKTGASAPLRVNLKIYLEGWKQLGDPASALWDAETYIGSQFNVGVRFSADAHTDH